MRVHLALFVAHIALLGLTTNYGHDRVLDQGPLKPHRQADDGFRLTEDSECWIDGKEVTREEFVEADGLTITEIAIEKGVVKVIKATTKGK